MSTTSIDNETDEIMLRLANTLPANQRCYALLCSVVFTSNFENDELARRLPLLAARLWPELDFSAVSPAGGYYQFGSLAAAFKDEYPEEFATAHLWLAEYELARIAIAKRNLRQNLALTKTPTRWRNATSGSAWRRRLARGINRYRARNDFERGYEQEIWCLYVRSALYAIGHDPEQAIEQINHLFSHGVSFQYDRVQGRNELNWLAVQVMRYSWLLSDYPEDVAFYRAFHHRMQVN